MASATSPQSNTRDPTFRNYDASSAAKYLQARPRYSDALIDLIISKHTSSGGALDLVVDVGCGPGLATLSLAPRFQHAIGADPGQNMIETAKSVGITTKSGEPVKFEVCSSEELSTLAALKEFSGDGKGGLECVDLITAATAAHWFDMPRFWGEAAKILKPGGSVIIWCYGGHRAHPDTPNVEKLQEWFKTFEEQVLAPYELPGNRLAREMYVNLGLPWECLDRLDDSGDQELKTLLKEFDEKEFERIESDRDGRLSNGLAFTEFRRVDFAKLKPMMSTASPITRWREANKEKVERGEVEDVLDLLVRKTKEIIEEVPEGKGRDYVENGSRMVILVVKKRK
ncbi:uncharacterized protein Z520_10807 [Fonsecaea multimorphosa CBS 102226]|uniref:Methyltransferase type 11 domain-containing protein n=1 Tax=Fonsecaea multimorphosa CBS 102226 TaxID=1442371 RepID=A0A0D2KAF6_9EURO|nr:uncharacterized protein Z520_10807 [Fonsecaea multimorphosa CBS 102226]KIX93388.1 hypothetical protein Z520_10807 [Fonsecaea multimorphosa CBS 102226]OAL18687.1 hypothetical protein AYO22_10380 [Fonsecaea multimorphosa]